MAAPGHAGEFDVVRARIHHYLTEEQIPSISIAVVRGDKILWEEGFGWADREKQIPATARTPYMLASASKPIAATAVMMAQQKGILSLDESVNKYLGKVRLRTQLGDASKTTVRDVLMHRSGLPNYAEVFYVDEFNKAPAMETLIHDYGTTMVPHGEFHYSNMGYPLLAHVVSRTSGQDFSAFVREQVFVPLGMDSSFVPTGKQLTVHRAIRYGQDHRRLREFATTIVTAAEIYSSVHDLARFAMFHMNVERADMKRLLSKKAVVDMQRDATEINRIHYRYGTGWSIGKDAKGRRQVFHGGGFHGCDSHMTLIPQEKVAVIVLSNTNRRWPGIAVSQDILDRTFAILLNDTIENVRLDYGYDASGDTQRPKELSGRWKGTVRTPKRELPVKMWFQPDGDIHVKLGDQLPTLLNHAVFSDPVLYGDMGGNIGTAEAHHPAEDKLEWNVRLIDGKLCGVIYVNYSGEPENAIGYTLPYWVELKPRK